MVQKNNNDKKVNMAEKILSLIDGDSKVVLADKLLSKSVVSILKDNELMDTIDAFFQNNLNISETSRNAFMHRNTLLYRIEKIHKVTGLNLRNLNDAVEFMFLKSIYNNTKNVR